MLIMIPKASLFACHALPAFVPPLFLFQLCSTALQPGPLFLLPHLASYMLACLSFPYTSLIFLCLSLLCQTRCSRLMFLLHASLFHSFFLNIFLGDFFSFVQYNIQHCFICRPSDSTVPTDTAIEQDRCNWLDLIRN
jgi:hypothetical protein